MAALDECTIMDVASTTNEDIEGNGNIIIAQATEEEYFICKFPDGSSSNLYLSEGQRNTLRLILDSVSVVSGNENPLRKQSSVCTKWKGGGGGGW